MELSLEVSPHGLLWAPGHALMMPPWMQADERARLDEIHRELSG